MDDVGSGLSKRKLLLFIGIGVLILATLGFLLLKGDLLSKESSYVVEVTVERGETTYEVRNYEELGRIILYKNGKKKEIMSKYPKRGEEPMSLPVVEGTYDVEGKGIEIATYTYESSLTESSKYINYLLSKGYKIEQKASTTEYIEIYMTKEEETRRIIIFNSKLMVGKLQSKGLPSYEQYIEKYKKD